MKEKCSKFSAFTIFISIVNTSTVSLKMHGNEAIHVSNKQVKCDVFTITSIFSSL